MSLNYCLQNIQWKRQEGLKSLKRGIAKVFGIPRRVKFLLCNESGKRLKAIR